MRQDRYGLPLTTTSDAAAAAFDEAADRLLAGVGSPLEAADAAVAEDAGLPLAHSVRASGLMLAGKPQAAREAAEQAVSLAAGASRRERQHAAIILDVVTGRRDAALAKIREHIGDFPRDALAIDPAGSVFGLIGFSGRQDREAEQLALLAPLAPHYGDHWWYGRVMGFALLECGAEDRALPMLEAALAARPDSGHLAHTWVHGLFETGEHQRALDWLAGWLPGFDPSGIMYCHLWWHLALFHLLRRDFPAMWAAYDAHCRAGQSASPAINIFTDGVALAWRSEVAGAERSVARLEALRAFGEEHFPSPGIFVDVHRAACLSALEDRAALAAFRADCQGALAAGRLAAGEVVLKITDGFEAFAQGDWARAHQHLMDATPYVVRIGGSRAQRRLVSETLAEAAARLLAPGPGRLTDHCVGSERLHPVRRAGPGPSHGGAGQAQHHAAQGWRVQPHLVRRLALRPVRRPVHRLAQAGRRHPLLDVRQVV